MNESQQQERCKPDRIPYQSPVLKVIELATDEVLGTGCKTLGDSVPTHTCGEGACSNQVGS